MCVCVCDVCAHSELIFGFPLYLLRRCVCRRRRRRYPSRPDDVDDVVFAHYLNRTAYSRTHTYARTVCQHTHQPPPGGEGGEKRQPTILVRLLRIHLCPKTVAARARSAPKGFHFCLATMPTKTTTSTSSISASLSFAGVARNGRNEMYTITGLARRIFNTEVCVCTLVKLPRYCARSVHANDNTHAHSNNNTKTSPT